MVAAAAAAQPQYGSNKGRAQADKDVAGSAVHCCVSQCALCRCPPRKNPRTRGGYRFGQFLHAASGENPSFAEQHDPVRDVPQGFHVVCHDHDGWAERCLQSQYQLIERSSAQRVKPGRGLVQEQQLRIERDGRAKAARLRMPPLSWLG